MAIEAGRGYRLEVGTALAAALTVTGVSKATEAVVTATNTLANGDFVMFGAVDGMTELSYLTARVKTVSGSSFVLEGIDSTNWGTWTAGTCQRVTTFSTISTATSIDFGAGSVDNLDATTLLDVSKQSLAGMLALPDVSVNLFTDYVQTVQSYIDSQAILGNVLPFRAARASGQRRCWAGIPSTIGESANVNQILSGSLSIIVRSTRYVKYNT
jgi:hypothetical protein